jgi:hypothetical protein
MATKKEIKICTRHDKQVPLIWTFAFPGAEYWCPYCGASEGMLGAGENVSVTPELKQAKKDWEKKSKKYLNAKSIFACQSFMYRGNRITPDQLPEKEKQRLKKIINEWNYEG